jgi:hypothetical protein
MVEATEGPEVLDRVVVVRSDVVNLQPSAGTVAAL